MERRSGDPETRNRSKEDGKPNARSKRGEESMLDAIQRLRIERRLALLFLGVFLAVVWVLSFFASAPEKTPLHDGPVSEAVQ